MWLYFEPFPDPPIPKIEGICEHLSTPPSSYAIIEWGDQVFRANKLLEKKIKVVVVLQYFLFIINRSRGRMSEHNEPKKGVGVRQFIL